MCRLLVGYREILAEQGDVTTDTSWHAYGLTYSTMHGMIRMFAYPGEQRATVSTVNVCAYVVLFFDGFSCG